MAFYRRRQAAQARAFGRRPIQRRDLLRVGEEPPVGEERQLSLQPAVEVLDVHETESSRSTVTIALSPGVPTNFA